MFPVSAMCGQRCGLHMTATIATPLAVRTGFEVNKFANDCGVTFMMSASFGTVGSLCFFEILNAVSEIEMRWFFLCASTTVLLISVHARMYADMGNLSFL
jgi:hypothetical protein